MNLNEVCGLCGLKRDEHGEVQHEFSVEGVLKKKAPPTVPRNIPPSPRGQAMVNDPTVRMNLKLIERLIAKGVLDGDDLLYIFGGDDVRITREDNQPASGNNSAASTE